MLRSLLAKSNTITTVKSIADSSILVADGKLKNIGDHVNGYYILLALRELEKEKNISFGIMEAHIDDEIRFLITANVNVAVNLLKTKFKNNPGVDSLNIQQDQKQTSGFYFGQQS